MRIDVITLFPELIERVVGVSLLGRALEEGLLEVAVTNPRDFTHDRHRTVDDEPYGGGAGMVMQCGPLFEAVEHLRRPDSAPRVVYMTPRGKRLDQNLVRDFATEQHLIVLCGRYEGIDERVTENLVTDEISIGDYVLSGGEVPALVLIEALSRMIPGVVGDWDSVTTDSFYNGLLAPPQYTRPATFRDLPVPDMLLSGNHAAIDRWRRKEALRATLLRRPDLLINLTDEDQTLLREIQDESPREDQENTP